MSGKCLADIEGHLVFHNVVTGSAQLVRHRFERQYPMALGFLSLIKSLDPSTITDGEIGRLDKRPSQMLVAVLVLPWPFFLPLLIF